VQYLKNEICLHCGRLPGNEQPLVGLNILDIGCGGGILSESMAALGANVHGIDVVAKSISVARQHSLQEGILIGYELTSVEDLIERERKYDIVLNMEVVEHVLDLPLFVSACAKLVADDGIMFVSTINRNLLPWLFAIVGAEYILRWLPRGTHAWRKFVQPGELETLLGQNGLAVNASVGVSVNPLTRRFSLCQRLAVNYMLSASPVRQV
jgi:2-polyprenyl-6-hydroxyphenyl methylase/3-demethylubiquinone-9 3-methyltransferase